MQRAAGPDNLRGAAWMAAAAVLFAAEALAIRWMTARGIPVTQQLAARSIGQLIWIAPLLLHSGLAVFHTRRAGLHVARGLCSLLTWGCYFASFGFLDLATATVLSFTNVMFSTLLAGPMLGERVGAARWAGTLLGLAGIAIMLRPGAEVSAVGAALALAAALSWCGITLGSRVLAQTEANPTILAWIGLVTTAGTLPLALAGGALPSGTDALVLLAFALVTPGILWLMSNAFRAGEASAVAPLQYLRLPIIAAMGWAIWREAPDAGAWAGGAVILIGALLVTVAEARARPR